MENTRQSHRDNRTEGTKGRIPLAALVALMLYGAYFYNLVRDQWHTLLQKQAALESIKAIAVPGTAFLKGLGIFALFKSSLFFLFLLGTMFLVFMILALYLSSPLKRAIFLFCGLLFLIIATVNDRVNLSFSLISLLSFTSFYLLTLPCRLRISLRDVLLLALLTLVLSCSLLYGSKHHFFAKTRDKVLFDTALGNAVITFYYTNSPLAASVISPERGVYQGLIHYSETKRDPFVYLGKGLFLTGRKEIQSTADFLIFKTGDGFFIKNRVGEILPLDTISSEEIERATGRLFSMKGFLRLTQAGLYFFPAGILILSIVGLRKLTSQRRVFVITSAGLASLFIGFIWYVSLTGNHPPEGDDIGSAVLSRDGLAIAYYIHQKKVSGGPYIPLIREMAKSDSAALRYWGARLIGGIGDRKESETLLTLMQDPCLNVRYVAAISLHRLLRKDSLKPLLTRMITDPSWYVRCRIFSVFLKIGMIPSPA